MYIGERAEIFYMDNTVGNWNIFCLFVHMCGCMHVICTLTLTI